MRVAMLTLSACLALAGCASGGSVNVSNQLPPEVTGPTWRWVSTLRVYGELKPDVDRYTLHFSGNLVQIQANCTAGTAPLGIGDNRQLSIGADKVSEDGCSHNPTAHEFLVDLGRIRQWTLKDGDLYLGYPGIGGGMHFTPATGATP